MAEKRAVPQDYMDHVKKHVPILHSFGLSRAADYLEKWADRTLELAPPLDISAPLGFFSVIMFSFWFIPLFCGSTLLHFCVRTTLILRCEFGPKTLARVTPQFLERVRSFEPAPNNLKFLGGVFLMYFGVFLKFFCWDKILFDHNLVGFPTTTLFPGLSGDRTIAKMQRCTLSERSELSFCKLRRWHGLVACHGHMLWTCQPEQLTRLRPRPSQKRKGKPKPGLVDCLKISKFRIYGS